MNSTRAAEVIIQALWPGPALATLDATVAPAASAPRAVLLMYASRSATRCSMVGSALASSACETTGNAAEIAVRSTGIAMPATKARFKARRTGTRLSFFIGVPFLDAVHSLHGFCGGAACVFLPGQSW